MSTDKKKLLEIYRTMVTIRQFETMAGESLSRPGKPGFIHLSIGQEGSSTGVCSCLRPDDYVATTHRGHGHMIAKGADMKRMVAELFRQGDRLLQGQGRLHAHRRLLDRHPGSATVSWPGGCPCLPGRGFPSSCARPTRWRWSSSATGPPTAGPVHEAMNMAAIWKLPILFVVENNQWASTTPQGYACALGDLCRRAAGYNMPGISWTATMCSRCGRRAWRR